MATSDNNCNTDNTGENTTAETPSWFVMRDLKRSNAKLPAYKYLEELGIKVFTPMRQQISVRLGKRMRKSVPVIPDLLFVQATRSELDPIVNCTKTLQYRFVKGGAYCQPMTVRNSDMDRFIAAVNSTESPVFYQPSEITPRMIGRRIRIIGGALDGHEGPLLSMRGSHKKHLIVELPGIMAVCVEIQPEFIQLIS